MKNTDRIGIIIPSLSPDDRLIKLVEELIQNGFYDILIVNDGSEPEYDTFFERAQALGAVVIRHAVNQGKGRALKTAFHYILNEWDDCTGVITIDSDGQHTVPDIIACRKSLKEHGDSLILGCRNFREANVPFKSRFGNIITSKVMKILVGIDISDTQTGLRAMSRELMKKYLQVSGERFEYETNMLIFSKEENIPVVEVPIATVYYEGNKSTHFRPFQDSVKIYGLFLRFIISSLSSSVIDIVLFTMGTHVLKSALPGYYIVVSTVVARVISSIYNFLLNRNSVFKSDGSLVHTMIKYYMLAVVQMSLSAAGVWSLYHVFGGNETVIKIVVDCILFLISFQIQREWVFPKNSKVKE
ncbi:MAG: glycosyltransferase [Lachnospiraceae bacterium]